MSSHRVAISGQEKIAFHQLLGVLLDANEPLVMLACLRRLTETIAHSTTSGVIEEEAGQRWYDLAVELAKVERELKRRGAITFS